MSDNPDTRVNGRYHRVQSCRTPSRDKAGEEMGMRRLAAMIQLNGGGKS
ncbi:MAG TPA: hypothetical protein VHZ07_01240 [Bryobacteraceae bacterium]|nr:hypothetical protein [Bryobacteraceae bacterium]